MGPKYGQPSGKLLKVEASEFIEVSPPVSPTPVDPLAHLRYTPITTPLAPTATVVRRYHLIPVLKKRRSRGPHSTDEKILRRKGRYSDNTVSFADENARQDRLQQKKKARAPPILPLDMVCPKLMTPWYETPIVTAVHQPMEVLMRKQPLGQCYLNSLSSSMGREERSLIRYDKMKENQMQVEQFLMSATGKTRGNLLLRKKQLLPKIAPEGLEQDIRKIERTVTPEEFTLMEFFSAGDSKYIFKSEIRPIVSRLERGYIIVTDWFGCPQVTDVIRARLGLASDNDEKSPSLMNHIGSIGPEFVPMMATLGVVSSSQEPKVTVSRCPEDTSYRGTLAHNEDFNLLDISQTRSGTCPSHQTYTEKSFPSLTVGDTALKWSTDHRGPDRPRVIELGCTAELGKNAISSVTMTNTGPTVIRISWVKKEHKDKLGLNKYVTTRFVFNSETRSILPNESFQIAFAYRSIQLGYYSEDWQLVTRPVLENGSDVIVRLWGITVATDSFKEERNVVEAVIKRREALTIVRKGLEELLQILPTKEVIFRAKRALPALLGSDLFLYRNPHLNYMTTQVYRLGKLMEMAEAKKERRGKSIVGGFSFAVLNDSALKSVSSEAVATSFERDLASSVEKADDDDVSNNSDESLYSVQNQPVSVRPSITTLKTWIRRAVNTDLVRRNQGPPLKRLVNAEEDTGSSFETPCEKNATWDVVGKFPTAPINVVNPDFCVHRLRDLIISMEDNVEEQEAFFFVMNENLEKLNFRPELAQPDLKLFYGRALLEEAVDKFNEYGNRLKVQCCLSQEQKKSFVSVKELPRPRSLLSVTSDNESSRSFIEENNNVSFNGGSAKTIPGNGGVSEENFNVSFNDESKMSIGKTMLGDDYSRQTMGDSPGLEETSVVSFPQKTSMLDGRLRSLGSLQSISPHRPPVAEVFKEETVSRLAITQKSTTDQPPTLTCPEINAKLAFDDRRYKCHYYNGLYGRMYQVLSEFLDNLDHVLASLQHPEPLKMNPEVVFTRKREIPRTDKDVKELLNAPLPPSWVKVAQRMEAVYATIKERRGVIKSSAN